MESNYEISQRSGLISLSLLIEIRNHMSVRVGLYQINSSPIFLLIWSINQAWGPKYPWYDIKIFGRALSQASELKIVWI